MLAFEIISFSKDMDDKMTQYLGTSLEQVNYNTYRMYAVVSMHAKFNYL